MNIERMPYQPSEEEHRQAFEHMSPEELEMSERREEELDNEVIDALLTKGRDSVETLKVIDRWSEMRGENARLKGTADAMVEEAIRAVRVYKRAGCYKEALEELESIKDIAASADFNRGDESKKFSNEVLDLEQEILDGMKGDTH